MGRINTDTCFIISKTFDFLAFKIISVLIKKIKTVEYDTKIALEDKTIKLKNPNAINNMSEDLTIKFLDLFKSKYAKGILKAIEAEVMFLLPAKPLR